MNNADAAPEQDAVSSADAALTWDDILELMNDLKVIARRLLQKEGNAGSVQTTQLVLTALRRQKRKGQNWEEVRWADRTTFFKAAHFAMRRALIDYARSRARRKEIKAGAFESSFTGPLLAAGVLDLNNLAQRTADCEPLAEAVDQALQKLDELYSGELLADIVQFRVFEKLRQEDVGRLIGCSVRTVRERQKLAYSLLAEELRPFFTGQ